MKERNSLKSCLICSISSRSRGVPHIVIFQMLSVSATSGDSIDISFGSIQKDLLSSNTYPSTPGQKAQVKSRGSCFHALIMPESAASYNICSGYRILFSPVVHGYFHLSIKPIRIKQAYFFNAYTNKGEYKKSRPHGLLSVS